MRLATLIHAFSHSIKVFVAGAVLIAPRAYPVMCGMNDVPTDRSRIRELECWLPLAQEVNLEQDWQCSGMELQGLIVRALPALDQACSAPEARAILQRVHHQQRNLDV